MVQFIAQRIAQLSTISLILLVNTQHPATANIFDDAISGIKSVAKKGIKELEKTGKSVVKKTQQAVETGYKEAKKLGEKGIEEGKKIGETAVDAVADRFKDTKLTRAADYGARKAAFETALRSATTVLTTAQKASDTTLATAEQTAQAALTLSEKFLADVVRKASPTVLQASAQSAKGILEGAKISTIATLQGTRWVINNTLAQLVLTHVRYEGDLKGLERGVLGNVQCEGVFFGQRFNVKLTLDPRDLSSITKSLQPLFNELTEIFTGKVNKPVKEAALQLEQTNKEAQGISKASAASSSSASSKESVDKAMNQLQTAVTSMKQAEDDAATKVLTEKPKLESAVKKIADKKKAMIETTLKHSPFNIKRS